MLLYFSKGEVGQREKAIYSNVLGPSLKNKQNGRKPQNSFLCRCSFLSLWLRAIIVRLLIISFSSLLLDK